MQQVGDRALRRAGARGGRRRARGAGLGGGRQLRLGRRRWCWCRRWSTSPVTSRCWPPVASPTAAGSRRRSRSAREGVLLGTRFLASAEMAIDRPWKERIVAADATDAVKVPSSERVMPPFTLELPPGRAARAASAANAADRSARVGPRVGGPGERRPLVRGRRAGGRRARPAAVHGPVGRARARHRAGRGDHRPADGRDGGGAAPPPWSELAALACARRKKSASSESPSRSASPGVKQGSCRVAGSGESAHLPWQAGRPGGHRPGPGDRGSRRTRSSASRRRGICGSDLHLYEVMGPFIDEGDILGHEPMGSRRGGGLGGRQHRARRSRRHPLQHLLRALLHVRSGPSVPV